MTRAELREFALAGAQARLQAISEERAAIIRVFPDLRTQSTRRAASLDGAPPIVQKGRKRRTMSAAERKAVGKRMKAYWAKRRAKNAPTASARRRRGMSADARKAVGERMRAYWAARRAGTQVGAGQTARRKTDRKK